MERIFKITLLMVFSLAATVASAQPLFTGNVPVMQGYTNENTSFITVFRQPGQEFTYEVTAKNAVIKLKSNNVGHSHHTDTLEISGLSSGNPYDLLIKDRSGHIVDTRDFQSLNQNLSDPKAAVCSCSRMGILSPDDRARSMWDRLADQKPDAIFFLGDLVYGDNARQAVWKWLVKKYYFYHPSFEHIQKRYIQSWQKERLYRQKKLIPVYSIWDDHDFGYDAADHTNPFKKKILELFRSYYPVPPASEVISRGPGVSYSFSIFNKKVLMLDNRTFYDSKNRTLLGMEQINWIQEQTRDQKEVIIASGMSVINISSQQESLERDAPTEWQAFRNIFRNSGTKAVFLTGDVHYSEVRQVPKDVFGYPTYVIVSSHMHSTTPLITPPFKSGKSTNPNQLIHVSGRNFALLSFKSLFSKIDAVFHRHMGLAPVKFVGDYGARAALLECKQFYK